MALRIKCILPAAILTVLVCGCSSSTGPAAPGLEAIQSVPQEARTANDGHNLWAYFRLSFDVTDPENPRCEVLPVRQAAGHWNILSWLEQSPCSNCFGLTKLVPSNHDSYLASVRIKHPFANPNLTGFDVRGIVIFEPGWGGFPESGLTYSDAEHGSGELLNPDGYTTLYNPTTEGHGMEGYIQGKFASLYYDAALLNAYKRFATNNPSNTRNAFYTGDSVIVTYDLKTEDFFFSLGYAIDACWAPPIKKPVTDPMTDFPISANCPEPWKLVAAEDPAADGMTYQGGQAVLVIDVYDWSGKGSYMPPAVECPEVFSGTLTASWKEDGPDYSRYEATIDNSNLAPGGQYKCLVAVEDNSNDPVGKPWLDLKAYQLCTLRVRGLPAAKATALPNPQSEHEAIQFSGDTSYDPDGGSIVSCEWDWENDGTYDESGFNISHTWDAPGTYYVQCRVTDEDGLTASLAQPVQITITPDGVPSAPTDITPPYLNFGPGAVAVSGAYAYTASGGCGLHIFDISNLSNPEWVNWIDIYEADDIHISGHLAFVAARYDGIAILDISNPASPSIVSWIQNMESTAIAVDGNYVYSIAENTGMTIIDVSSPESPQIVKTVQYPGMMWFAVDIACSNGYVYLALEFDGMAIIDVSPPEGAFITGTVKTFMNCILDVDALGNYAYMADTNNGLTIVDVTLPQAPQVLKTVNLSGMAEHVVSTDAYAYVTQYYGGLAIVDISQPQDADLVNTVELPRDAYDLSVSKGYALVACGGDGLLGVDVDPPLSASVVGSIDTVGPSQGVAVSPGYAYTADLYSGFQVTDIEPSMTAHVLSSPDISGYVQSVVVSGSLAYVACSSSGLSILDISSPGTPQTIKTVDVPGQSEDVVVSNGYAYVLTAVDGLQIVDIEPPEGAYVAGSVAITGQAEAVDVAGDYVYVTANESTLPNDPGYLHIIHAQAPSTAHIECSVPTQKHALGLTVSDGYAYVGLDSFGLEILDIDPPESACSVSSVGTYGSPTGIVVQNGYAYLAAGWLDVVDVDPPESAALLTTAYIRNSRDLVVTGNMAYVAAGSRGLRIVRLW